MHTPRDRTRSRSHHKGLRVLIRSGGSRADVPSSDAQQENEREVVRLAPTGRLFTT